MALDVGSTIAHYKVTAKIGEGGMGEVTSSTRHEARLGRGAESPAASLYGR